jgi:hypothetical protein
MCKQSAFHPLMGDEEEFRVEHTDEGVRLVFRTHDGVERPVLVPMRPLPENQRPAA